MANEIIRKRLAVFGSRSLDDSRISLIINNEIECNSVTEIITAAEPNGVCGIARELCKQRAMPLKLYFLNFKYLRGAFEHRSKAILRDCDVCVLIHDGKSKGTKNEYEQVLKMKIPHKYYVLEIQMMDINGINDELDL